MVAVCMTTCDPSQRRSRNAGGPRASGDGPPPVRSNATRWATEGATWHFAYRGLAIQDLNARSDEVVSGPPTNATNGGPFLGHQHRLRQGRGRAPPYCAPDLTANYQGKDPARSSPGRALFRPFQTITSEGAARCACRSAWSTSPPAARTRTSPAAASQMFRYCS
jgi:hypothetical protein